MAVADADSCFTIVDVGSEGRNSDGGIFKTSNIGKCLEENKLNLPPNIKISEIRPPLPYIFVADEAFPLTTYMMRPYARGTLNNHTKVFNYRLSRARRVVENAFGIMVSRWRIFRKPIIAKLDTIEKIIQACVCLHNCLKKSDDNITLANRRYSTNIQEDEPNVNPGIINIQRTGTNMYSRNASEIRCHFADFFNAEGAVEWQWNKIRNNDL